MDLEEEIKQIRARNQKVEMDKAWETSFTRKILVTVGTYFVMVLVMFALGMTHPYIGAVIPTLGFLLSTLSINFAKSVWVRKCYDKKGKA